MSKELPWFKFEASEYINGSITLEGLLTQGVFVNICAHYWFNGGCLKLSEIKRRVKCKDSVFESLVASNLIEVQDDYVKVKFLDKQFNERGHISKINSLNGKLGGAPKGNKNAKKPEVDNQQTTEIQPNITNIEETKKIIRREQDKNVDLFDIDFNLFWNKYDKKTDKPLCQKKWDNLTPETKKKILAHLDAYIPATPDKAFRKNPLTYLRNFAWENEVIPIQNAKKTDKKESATDFLKRVKETV